MSTCVRTPGALELVGYAEAFRVEFNTIRPHEALSWNSPIEVHTGRADPSIPTFDQPETLPPSCGTGVSCAT